MFWEGLYIGWRVGEMDELFCEKCDLHEMGESTDFSQNIKIAFVENFWKIILARLNAVIWKFTRPCKTLKN